MINPANRERSGIQGLINNRAGRGIAIAALSVLASTISEGRPSIANASNNFSPDASTSSASGPDPEKCSFKVSVYSVWLRSEPPLNLQLTKSELKKWAIENNQIAGPAPDRIMDLSIDATGRRFGVVTTDKDGIGLTEAGRSIILTEAPIQKGVDRFFKGRWWKTALVDVFDRVTTRKQVEEVLCDCLTNIGIPRWNKNATPEPTVTPTATQEPAAPTLTPTPTSSEVCAPIQAPIPCRTRKSLLNPIEEDPGGEDVEVGRLDFNGRVYSLGIPSSVNQNLFMEAA